MTSLGNAIAYGFAVGRVRVLEGQLLGKDAYERLLDASDFAEQRRILSDTLYGGYLEDAETAEEVERGLEAALNDLYDEFLGKANVPRPVFDFFRTPRRFAQLRSRVKTGMLEAAEADAGSDGADMREVPPDFSAELSALSSLIGEPVPPLDAAASATIERFLDRAMFSEMLRLAKESGSPYLDRLARTRVDLANIKTVLRARRMDVSARDARKLQIGGGTLTEGPLMAGYEKSLRDYTILLGNLPMLSAAPSAELSDLAGFDVAEEWVLAAEVMRMRSVPLGPEPVLGYVLARDAEVPALRLLLTGKLAGVPREPIRSRLRRLLS